MFHKGEPKEKVDVHDFRWKRMWSTRKGLKDGYWHPPELRHKDLTKWLLRTDDMMPKRDLEAVIRIPNLIRSKKSKP